ncbi:hypothetical protein [Brevibacillus daliensis]|uniref:hypothetical protein n=1 Tax=Brevibacillus daliensis TaxID=2892995 RepID=UPI001E5E69B4|nr:hypothetical protein [Brevibacillus daliensis]
MKKILHVLVLLFLAKVVYGVYVLNFPEVKIATWLEPVIDIINHPFFFFVVAFIAIAYYINKYMKALNRRIKRYYKKYLVLSSTISSLYYVLSFSLELINTWVL